MWEETKRKSYMKKYHRQYRDKMRKLGLWNPSNGNRIAAHKKWSKRNPEKIKAYNKLNWAIKTGKIKRPNKCSKCNNKGIIMAHHSDYCKPFKVKWLCWICHVKLHNSKFIL